ncbi:hypothetical protein K4K53_002306 [Colletotrichum sp. SAR 10_77]|nr:hypothetical protein K4K53_002306 [Colletotrichum sp. SAR 10_77]
MGKWLDELWAANPPAWALEEAENFIDKNRHRVNLDALADPAKAKKYYVVYWLRGSNAADKQYGIFSNHSECQKQLTGCNNRNEASSGEQDIEPPVPKLPLSPEQKRAFDLAINGHNLFITGSGGCGKSYLVETLNSEFRARRKKVHLLAPTGQAAVNIGGRTTFSYMGWRPDDLGKSDQTLVDQARGQLVWKRITSTNVLIIDEINYAAAA